MRKPIFDTIRAERGRGFTVEEVQAIDRLLDQLGIERDDGSIAPTEPEAAPEPLPVNVIGLDDRDAFFSSIIAASIFGSSGLKPDQEQGLDTVLSAAKEAAWPLAFTAYALATACHETAYTMQPVREAFWLNEDWRRRNLRYYPFYGRGYVQLTWRSNYEKADRELDLGGRLLANLDLAMDRDIAARIMVKGMQEGWFAGDRQGRRHTLARHLPAAGPASADEFKSARRIINGTDKAAKIAGEALGFQAALEAGVW